MQYQLQQTKLEDLYTAFLLGGAKKSSIYNRYTVEVQEERLTILNYYLDRFNLHNSFLFIAHKEIEPGILTIEFETTLSLKRIYKEWCHDDMVIAISPMNLNLNAYLLWVSIFAEKRKNFIRLSNEHISHDAKLTLASLFKESTGIEMSTNSIQFAIHDGKALTLLAIHMKRPAYEIRLLTEFLSDREFKKLQVALNTTRFSFRRGLYHECY